VCENEDRRKSERARICATEKGGGGRGERKSERETTGARQRKGGRERGEEKEREREKGHRENGEFLSIIIRPLFHINNDKNGIINDKNDIIIDYNDIIQRGI